MLCLRAFSICIQVWHLIYSRLFGRDWLTKYVPAWLPQNPKSIRWVGNDPKFLWACWGIQFGISPYLYIIISHQLSAINHDGVGSSAQKLSACHLSSLGKVLKTLFFRLLWHVLKCRCDGVAVCLCGQDNPFAKLHNLEYFDPPILSRFDPGH